MIQVGDQVIVNRYNKKLDEIVFCQRIVGQIIDYDPSKNEILVKENETNKQFKVKEEQIEHLGPLTNWN